MKKIKTKTDKTLFIKFFLYIKFTSNYYLEKKKKSF